MPTVSPVINNVYEATDKFLKFLRDWGGDGMHFRVTHVFRENNDRHRLIVAEIWRGKWKLKTVKFYLIYVRNWFEQFGKFFNMDSKGTSIRLDILERLYQSDIDYIIIVHRTDGIFMMETDIWYNIAKSGKWIRKTEKTGETLANIPLYFLRKLGD